MIQFKLIDRRTQYTTAKLSYWKDSHSNLTKKHYIHIIVMNRWLLSANMFLCGNTHTPAYTSRHSILITTGKIIITQC